MKYILSNRAVPFWIYRVGESKAQNKQHSDLDLSAITVCDRLERASFGSTAKTRALIDTIPRPQRSLPFNKCPFQQLGPSSRRQQGTAGEAHVHVLTCLRWLLMYVCSACVCMCSLVADFNQGLQPCPNISSLLGLLVWRKWVDSGSRAFLEEFKTVWGLWLLHPVQSLQRQLYASPWRPGLAMHSTQRYQSDKTRGRHHSFGQSFWNKRENGKLCQLYYKRAVWI